MRMQADKEEFIVLHDVKKVHRRVFCLASKRLAAASDTRDRALQKIIPGRRVVLSGCVVDLGRWSEGRMPERLGIGLGLRERGEDARTTRYWIGVEGAWADARRCCQDRASARLVPD